MADIVLSVDYSDLASAKREMDELRKTLGQAQQAAKIAAGAFDDAFLDAALAISKVNKEQNLIAQNQKSINAVLGIDKAFKSAAESAEAFSEALAFRDQKVATALALGEQKLRELAKAEQEAAKAAAALAREKDQLKKKYDAVYSASKLYEDSLAEIDRAHAVGAISAKKQAAEVEKLTKEYQDFQNGSADFSNRFVQHTNQASRGLNNFGFYAQQVGYQVGDFFVQVQSGTNFLVAFGQQFTQLAGLLPGLWGAIIGIGVSSLTALGAAWMRTRKDTDAATDGVYSYAESLKALKDVSGNLSTQMEMLRFGVDTEAEAEALRNLLDLERKRVDLAERWAATDNLGTRQRLAEEALVLQEQYTTQKNIVTEIEKKREALDKANLINQGMLAVELGHARAMGQRLKEEADTRNRIYATYAATRMEAEQVAAQVKLLESGMSQAAVDALRFAGVDLTSGVSAAAREAAALAGNMQISLTAALNLINLRDSKTYGGRGGDPRDFLPGGSKYTPPGAGPFVYEPPEKISEGGSGGGPKTDPMETLLKEISRQKELLGLNQQQADLKKEIWKVEDALGESAAKYSAEKIAAIAKENLAIEAQLKLQEEQNQKFQNIADTIKSSMTDSFMSIVDGTSSVEDAFKNMAQSIIKQLYQVLVVQQMVGSFDVKSGTGSGIVGLLGKAFSSFEGGGYTGSGSRSGGLDGRGGFLAMVHPNETIIDHTKNKLVSTAAKAPVVTNNEAPVTVNNNITVTGSDAAMVRAEVAKMIPQITNATKAAIVDAKQRGGQMAAAFR